MNSSKWSHPQKKNPSYKIQGQEPIHKKYKANESTSRHNPKKKQQQTMNKKYGKNSMQMGLMATK